MVAVSLRPNSPGVHVNLGETLRQGGQFDEALACFQQALTLAPADAVAHLSLGQTLAAKGEVDEAIASYRKALAIDPKFAQAHHNLGNALLVSGQLREAREAFVRALEFYPPQESGRAAAAQQVQTCQRLLALEARLPRLLNGEDKPGFAAEGLDLAALCQFKRRHAAAARFFAGAFVADPRLAEDSSVAHRFSAASSAALAAAVKGEDAAGLDEKERARLRQQALDWLRAERTLLRRALQQGGPVQASAARAWLLRWQKDSALASLRAAEELKNLPAAEQQAWRSFWADVGNLLAGETEAPGGP